MNNRDFRQASIEELSTILEGQTIKKIETEPAIGSNGFTIICEGEEGADGVAVSFCQDSPTGSCIHVG